MFNLNKEYQYIVLDLNINEPNIADEEPPKPVFEKKALSWEDDMQLYSKFLDRKVGETSKPGNIPQRPGLLALLILSSWLISDSLSHNTFVKVRLRLNE